MTADAVETAAWAIQRHRHAATGVLVVALMFALAAVINALWHTALGNVIAGLLIVFAGAFAFVMFLVGASMGIHRLRHDYAG